VSGDEAARLVVMANQIARFFASQKGAAGAAGVADHLRAFWEPHMRHKLIAWTQGGGEGLHPLAADAVALMQGTSTGAMHDALARAGEPTATAPGDDAG